MAEYKGISHLRGICCGYYSLLCQSIIYVLNLYMNIWIESLKGNKYYTAAGMHYLGILIGISFPSMNRGVVETAT